MPGDTKTTPDHRTLQYYIAHTSNGEHVTMKRQLIIIFEYRKIFLPLPLYLSMKSPFDCIMPDGKIAAYIIYRKMEEEGGDMNSNLQQVD